MAKVRVFIGSSSEAKDRGIVPTLTVGLSKDFDILPWDEAFDQGRFTLEALLDRSKEVDAAILVFAKDDIRESRTAVGQVTRDNVILEAGLFLAQLDRERVWILAEEGVELPGDFGGLTVSLFRSVPDDGGTVMNAELALRINDIKEQWNDLLPRPKQALAADGNPLVAEAIDDSGIGVKATFAAYLERMGDLVTDLRNFAQDNSAKRTEPLYLDSTRASLDAYAEALDQVKERFWTTSYLSSGFWGKEDLTVIEANTRMLERLQHGNGRVRRLFLLTEQPQSSLNSWKQELIDLRNLNNESAIRRRKGAFDNVKRGIQRMVNEGTEVKIAFDDPALELLETIGSQIGFEYGDSEIAIYDKFRADIFGGGSTGNITEVRICSEATSAFDVFLDRLEHYLDTLWQDAVPAEEYLGSWDEAYDSFTKRIDYAPNWLALYEFDLPSDDEEVKTVEINRVKEILYERDLYGQVKLYLDVGTCTGRYPIGLLDGLTEDGEVLGIDDDPDAIRFARGQLRDRAKGDKRIRIQQMDFAAREIPDIGNDFDLITCMLGTLSHFGADKQADFEDTLQFVLRRMADLLSRGGLLMLGNWSEYAKTNRELLSIYRASDRRRLAEWTPDREELRDRLTAVGLVILDQVQPVGRLDLFVCQRRGA